MIHPSNSRHTVILVLGDLVAYFFSLVLTLTLRYGAMPGRSLMASHLPAFSLLFVLFLIINYSSGLYNKQSLLMAPSRSLSLLIRSQVFAVLVSVAFFYFAPVGISPRANLFIYVVISTIALAVWRLVMFPVVSASRSQRAILIGSGAEVDDLYAEVNSRGRYGMIFAARIPLNDSNSATQLNEQLIATLKQTGASALVADLHNRAIEPLMPELYSLIFKGTQVLDAARFYEGIFDRVPLSMVGERWLVENTSISVAGRRIYDLLKRLMDIVIAFILGVISLIIYPFVYLAIKLEDGGSIFIVQNRLGRGGKHIKIIKFRSMTANDNGAYANGGKSELKITKVGAFIRVTRIDELPQLWNVLRGDLSLIGPRPEFPGLVEVYEKQIPYYNVRHLIKPGLSGWAQIYHTTHPHHAVAIGDTRDKLSYDLYYVKNRSFMLDVKIALQTARALISRRGV